MAERMLRALALESAELSLVLCDDAVMRDLNRQYRQLDRTTDVLAFALGEGPGDAEYAGPMARRHRDLVADSGASGALSRARRRSRRSRCCWPTGYCTCSAVITER